MTWDGAHATLRRRRYAGKLCVRCMQISREVPRAWVRKRAAKERGGDLDDCDAELVQVLRQRRLRDAGHGRAHLARHELCISSRVTSVECRALHSDRWSTPWLAPPHSAEQQLSPGWRWVLCLLLPPSQQPCTAVSPARRPCGNGDQLNFAPSEAIISSSKSPQELR